MSGIILMFFMGNVSAQKGVGEWSFIPRVGVNLSNLGGLNDKTSGIQTNKHNSAFKHDFMLGAESEYQILKPLGLSIGAFYSRQGCHWAPYETLLSPTKAEAYDEERIKLQYVNIPFTANYYITDFLAVRAGLQCGLYIDGSWTYTHSDVVIDAIGAKTYGDRQERKETLVDMNKAVWSIPVAVSLEYENVLLDMRYNIPISKFSNTMSRGSNQVFTFNVGYRL